MYFKKKVEKHKCVLMRKINLCYNWL